MAHPGVQLDRARDLGGGPHGQRALRSTVYICDLRNGALVHVNGDRIVLAAMEASGHSATLSLHGISVAPSDLCAHRRGVDLEYDHHSSHRSLLGNRDCADRSSGIYVLEVE